MINIIFNLFQRLSLNNIQRVGAFLGILAYILSNSYRKRLKENIDLAKKLYPFEVKAWEATKGAGMMLADNLWIWGHPKEALAMTQVKSWDTVSEALKENKGLIIITPHIGAFEIIPRYLAEHFPSTLLYKPAKQAWLRKIIDSGRVHPRTNFVPANLQGVRELAKALHRGEAIGLLPDQVPSVGDGIWAKYFGRYAYTAVLPTKIAKRNNTPVIFIIASRIKNGKGWTLEITRMMEPFSNDLVDATNELNSLLEQIIVKYPEQYLWSYNRYKHPAGAEPPPTDELDTA